MHAREPIDIEALLYRAYGEKRIDRFGNVNAVALGLTKPRPPGSTFSSAGKVDTASFSARAAAEVRELQLRLAAVPSGLLDLHDAVLGLDDFYVERGGDLDFLVWDADTAEHMGHRITPARSGDGATIVKVRRRGGRGPGRDDLLEYGRVRPLVAITTAVLVVLHGRHADRPYLPDVVVSGRTPIYEGGNKRAVGYRLQYDTPLHAVTEARATYAAWHSALTLLRELFANSTEYEVTGPHAPACPWEASHRVLIGAVASSLVAAVEAEPDPAKAQRKKRQTAKQGQVGSGVCPKKNAA